MPLEMRPPGALAEDAFLQACTHCGDCAAACPQAIITSDEEGFPKVDVSARECLFCGECAKSCDAGSILSASGWAYRAQVGDGCLSQQGITCRACEDHCDAQAIRFRLMTGGRSTPEISIEDCTGCGACVAPCPSDAVTLVRPATHSNPSAQTASETDLCTISADA